MKRLYFLLLTILAGLNGHSFANDEGDVDLCHFYQGETTLLVPEDSSSSPEMFCAYAIRALSPDQPTTLGYIDYDSIEGIHNYQRRSAVLSFLRELWPHRDPPNVDVDDYQSYCTKNDGVVSLLYSLEFDLPAEPVAFCQYSDGSRISLNLLWQRSDTFKKVLEDKFPR